MSMPATPIRSDETARARDERVRRELDERGLSPDALNEDLTLSPPLTEEEKAEFLRDAETWASPELLAKIRLDLERA